MVLLSVLSSLLSQLAQFTLTSLSLVQGDTMAAILSQASCPSDEERMKVYTVEPPNNGHVGNECFVRCTEVVPSSEVEMYGAPSIPIMYVYLSARVWSLEGG